MRGEVFTGVEIRRVRRDGQPLNLKLSCGATYDGKGNATGVTAVFEDITQSRRLEEQFRQAQKMEAVGRLAGGIAHDFNNLLTVVLGASDMLLQELPPNDENHGVVKEIKEAGERAAALTTQLLAFSRKQLVEPKVFVVNQLVTNMEKMLRRLIGEDVEVSVRLEPELGSVKADIGHVEQVLLNLVVNARDAMPRGGLIVIETRNVTLDEHYVHLHQGVKPGEYVMLAVSDTGIGMSEETRSKMFEPFFTTKEAGKGTGLGLATCYGIVKQAGGHIGVYSEVGVGTTMKVYLPKVARNGSSISTVHEKIKRGSETILLVEDDKAVRGITRRMLLSQGYTVLEASDGAEALELLGSNSARVDLLLTDVVLPGMGGREVAEKARAMRPDIKVLFVSGYTDDVILQNQLLEHDVSLLQKPFTPQALARKLRESIDGPSH
jgi:signal transduction histidine kinase/CheY-like chemotaxis protein